MADDYPQIQKFRNLTRQEEKHALLAEASTMGTADGWRAALDAKRLALRGHRLIKAKVQREKS